MTKLLYCAGLVGLTIALWLAVSRGHWMDLAVLKSELVTIGLQALVFGLAGGGIKLLLDQATAQRKFRSEVLERLGQAHKQVYRVRRLLKVSSEAEQRRLLGELMDARQELGSVYHDVRLWLKPRNQESIQGHLQGIRDYIEKVVEGALAPDRDTSKKAVYEEFLRFGEPGRYDTDFKSRYLQAKTLADTSFKFT